MQKSLLSLQIECDRAARELLVLPSWAEQRSRVYAAVNVMTSGSPEAAAALAWLINAAGKLPPTEEGPQKLHQLVHADAALREYRTRPEAARELFECQFPARVRDREKVA